ncbi:hypothetical protein F5Y16DRAFT_378275 [Xylariaceae sp. FL0255]|nr:hypothetical protein F5Y16DRAFT_378275 [Xylariaceae sp. FL0255]
MGKFKSYQVISMQLLMIILRYIGQCDTCGCMCEGLAEPGVCVTLLPLMLTVYSIWAQ